MSRECDALHELYIEENNERARLAEELAAVVETLHEVILLAREYNRDSSIGWREFDRKLAACEARYPKEGRR